MNTFYQIVHKMCAQSDELYKMSCLNDSVESSMVFANAIWEYEMPHPDKRNYLAKSLIFIHMVSHYRVLLSKFQFLDSIRKNDFISDETKDEIFTVFMKAQRRYQSFGRLCYRYKHRRAPLSVKEDLFLYPINESRHNVMTILQNGQRYLFTIMDLRNIIEGSLSNSPYHFSEPLPIKNPYNNLAFDKSILYNIYFFMKRADCVMSPLFHQYFLCNFNLTKLRDSNAAMIRDVHISQYLKNADSNCLRIHILDMLSTNGARCNFLIHKDFPTTKLITIMRPYLEMYYREHYSLDLYTQSYLRNLLSIKLKEFYDFNPKFGRKFFCKNEANKRVANFYEEHIQFKSTTYVEKYEKSHLELMDTDEFVGGFDESDDSDSVS